MCYIFVYTHIHARIHAYCALARYVCMYTHTCTTYAGIRIYMRYIRVYILIHTRPRAHTHVLRAIYAFKHIYMLIYKHTHVHVLD